MIDCITGSLSYGDRDKVDKEIFTPSFILKRMYDVTESYLTLDLFSNIISMFKNGEELYKTSDILDKENIGQRILTEKIENLKGHLEDVYKFAKGRPTILI